MLFGHYFLELFKYNSLFQCKYEASRTVVFKAKCNTQQLLKISFKVNFLKRT